MLGNPTIAMISNNIVPFSKVRVCAVRLATVDEAGERLGASSCWFTQENYVHPNRVLSDSAPRVHSHSVTCPPERAVWRVWRSMQVCYECTDLRFKILPITIRMQYHRSAPTSSSSAARGRSPHSGRAAAAYGSASLLWFNSHVN